MTTHYGPHLLQTPGPTNVPPQVLSALGQATIDHRGPAFAELSLRVLGKLKSLFQTERPVFVYPSSGTGAWEAALVNTLSPGDHILAFETGHFSTLWRAMAERLGLTVDFIPGDWRRGVDPAMVEERLRADTSHRYKAVMVVHNETSTGVTSRVPEIREALDRAGHPALLLVDTISSLGSADYRHDEWMADVTVGCSQKGLMLPPGLGFNVASEKAVAAAEDARLPRSYWDWRPLLEASSTGFFPYTPATNMFFALDVAVDMLLGEGLTQVFARHARHAGATRAAVDAWGLEVLCENPAEYSNSVTAVLVPESFDVSQLIRAVLDQYNMALGVGLGKLAGRVFRIGHLGYLSDPWLIGVLGGVEMGLRAAGYPVKRSGVDEAISYLSDASDTSEASAEPR